MVVAAGIAAYFYFSTAIYHPVVHLKVSERLSVVALLPATQELDACRAANERFAAPFASCNGCRVTAATCERQLTGIELALREGSSLPHPVVVAKDSRIAVLGPGDAARAGCNLIAADMVAKGVKSAVCLPPGQPPS